MQLSLTIQNIISEKFLDPVSRSGPLQVDRVAGGDINKAYRISSSDYQLFCKVNAAAAFPELFCKEKNGLELIKKQQVIKTPEVLDCFEADTQQILLLEWIQESSPTEKFWKMFGKQLAALHSLPAANFGLEEDNYMGSVPQTNTFQPDWITFFTTQRLQPLINSCQNKGTLTHHHTKQFDKLFLRLPTIFDKEDKPSLVHGDLWSGNFMCGKNGEPVLIDPAVYYGHRSMDLAMTTLFGGFDPIFYEAYNYQFPLPANYAEQWEICNLYPLLIHLYLFGRTYLSKIEQTLTRFV